MRTLEHVDEGSATRPNTSLYRAKHLSALLMIYVCLGYPLLSASVPRPYHKDHELPSLQFLLTRGTNLLI